MVIVAGWPDGLPDAPQFGGGVGKVIVAVECFTKAGDGIGVGGDGGCSIEYDRSQFAHFASSGAGFVKKSKYKQIADGITLGFCPLFSRVYDDVAEDVAENAMFYLLG